MPKLAQTENFWGFDRVKREECKLFGCSRTFLISTQTHVQCWKCETQERKEKIFSRSPISQILGITDWALLNNSLTLVLVLSRSNSHSSGISALLCINSCYLKDAVSLTRFQVLKIRNTYSFLRAKISLSDPIFFFNQLRSHSDWLSTQTEVSVPSNKEWQNSIDGCWSLIFQTKRKD